MKRLSNIPKDFQSSNAGYYINNPKYTEFLEMQDIHSYKKYVDYIIKYQNNSKNKLFLDIGCGTGSVLELLKSTNREAIGVDISRTSIEVCKKKKLKCVFYDGVNLPFADRYFDIVGSYNVLEHIDDAVLFLSEILRVLKNNGYLVLAFPNFLSITNNYHNHTKGIYQKGRNLLSIIRKLSSPGYRFEKMTPIYRDDFKPDDDARCLTNPIDILRWIRESRMHMEYWSSSSFYRKGIANLLDFSFLRLFLGSCFMVLRKQ